MIKRILRKLAVRLRPGKYRGKFCEKCGWDNLIPFRSMNYRMCSRCHHRMPWDLKPGQKPLVTSSKDSYNKPEDR